MGYLTIANDVPTPVEFKLMRASGIRILAALSDVARSSGIVLQITCGSNSHPALDPHTLGEAYDVRSHNLSAAQKQLVLNLTMNELLDGVGDIALPVSGGIATKFFFGFLEAAGTPNEHFHFQRRKGVVWPPVTVSAAQTVKA